MKRKHIDRREWTQFRNVTYARCRCLFHGTETEVQRMHIGHVTEPFRVKGANGRLTIADDDYSWLQVAPKGGYWWLTAMLDPSGRLLQCYFDMTDGNVLTDGADAYFDDLYLDVVMHADGTLVTLDADELDAACARGEISKAQRQRTLTEADRLRRWLSGGTIQAELTELYGMVCEKPLKSRAELC